MKHEAESRVVPHHVALPPVGERIVGKARLAQLAAGMSGRQCISGVMEPLLICAKLTSTIHRMRRRKPWNSSLSPHCRMFASIFFRSCAGSEGRAR